MDKFSDTIFPLNGGGGDHLRDLSWHPSGTRLACIYANQLHIYGVGSMLHLFRQTYGSQLGSHPRKVLYSPDGSRIAVLGKDTGLIIDEAGQVLDTISVVSQNCNVCFTEDGKHLLTVMSGNRVVLYNLATKETIALKRHDESITSLTVSPDGSLLASGDSRGQVVIWNLRNNSEVRTFNVRSTILALKFSHDSKMLATSDTYPFVALYNIERDSLHDLPDANGNNCCSLSFSSTGTHIAAASTDARIYLFSPATQRRIDVLQGHGKGVNVCAFSPDGKTLASGAGDGTVRLWPIRIAPGV